MISILKLEEEEMKKMRVREAYTMSADSPERINYFANTCIDNESRIRFCL